MESTTVTERPRWKRILALLAIVIGGLLVLLAFGFGISVDGGLKPGAIVLFGLFLIGGGGLAAWGVKRVRR